MMDGPMSADQIPTTTGAGYEAPMHRGTTGADLPDDDGFGTFHRCDEWCHHHRERVRGD